MIRNQTGGGREQRAGRSGGRGRWATGACGCSSRRCRTCAAFGNSFDFAGVPLDDFETVSYSTFNADDRRAAAVVADRDRPSPHRGHRRRRPARIHHPHPRSACRSRRGGSPTTLWPTTLGTSPVTRGRTSAAHRAHRCTFAEVLDAARHRRRHRRGGSRDLDGCLLRPGQRNPGTDRDRRRRVRVQRLPSSTSNRWECSSRRPLSAAPQLPPPGRPTLGRRARPGSVHAARPWNAHAQTLSGAATALRLTVAADE